MFYKKMIRNLLFSKKTKYFVFSLKLSFCGYLKIFVCTVKDTTTSLAYLLCKGELKKNI